MITSTLLLSLVLLSPLDWSLIAQRAVAAATYTSNLLFAWRGGDYFSGPLETSPYLHTWSLGVEEQFYIVWPIVVLLAVRWSRPSDRSRQGGETRLAVVMGVIAVASFTVNILLTNQASPWAFFGLASRAWEFAVAGLAIALLHDRSFDSPGLRRVAAGSGALGLVGAVWLLDGQTPYPGTAALLPVVATMLLLVAGHGLLPGETAPIRLLSQPAMLYLGRLSYSWYLWHWPFIVLLTGALYRDTIPLRLLAALIALPVAAVSYKVVENPVRFSKRLRASRPRTYALGAAATMICLVAAFGVYRHTQSELSRAPYRELHAARESYHQYECEEVASPAGANYCLAGDSSAHQVLMLIGDSHAGQWMTAFSDAAADEGLKLVLRASGNCSATPNVDAQRNGHIPEEQADCAEFQQESAELVSELHPTAVVLSDATASRNRSFPDGPSVWSSALESQIHDLARQGIRVGVVVDNPLSNDPILCVARGHSEDFCTPTRDDAYRELDRYSQAVEPLAEDEVSVPVLDVNDRVCTDTTCRIRDGDTWIFGSFEHFTGDFTQAQGDRVRAFLDQLQAEA